jgi:general nucleoside transport system ATP-binding protein
MSAAVTMRAIDKRFPLVHANNRVDFELAWGEVHALIGENGAGKSTLMKILYGLQPPDSGSLAVAGEPVHFRNAGDAIRHGIGMVHQHFMLVETLTVAENLVLGREPHRGPWLDLATARTRAREMIARFGFDLDPDVRIQDLPVGLQQQVEILKALFRDARILIMDEPTAVLTPQETRGLFEFLRQFADAGHAVVFISHKLDEVMEICDRMSVMRDGHMVGTVARDGTDTRALASMMVGREVLLRVAKGSAHPGEVRLEARGLSLSHPRKHKPLLANIDLQVRGGEIVGIAGIEGNGQTELVEVLTGLRHADHGEVHLAGRDVTRQSARQRRQAGISHVPEDRNERGLVRPYTAAWNSILGDHHRAPYADRFGFLDTHAIEAHARRVIDAYDVRPRSTTVLASSYSGGNAQKLIIARELERDPRVLIAAQPTRGVDIGAIEFIHRQILAARDRGLAVLLVSADLNEVLSLADRILVLFEGRIMGSLLQSEATPEALGLLMAGTPPPPSAATDASRSPVPA